MRIPKTLIKNFIIYFSIFFISVSSLVFFTYTRLIQQFQKTTYELELSYQNSTINDFQNELEQLESSVTQLTFSQFDLQHDISQRIQLINELNHLRTMNNYLTNIILYIPDSNVLYSADSTYTLNSFEYLFGKPFAELLKKMSEEELSAKGLVPLMVNSTLCFTTPYPFHSIYPYGYLIFITDQNQLLSLTDLPYALYWENQLLINCTGRDELPKPEYSSTVIQENTYCFLNSSLGKESYTLVTLRDAKLTFSAFYKTRNAFIFLTIFVSSVATFLISLFSYHSYKPYRHLQLALTKTGLLPEKSTQAKSAIYQAIQTLDILTHHNRFLDQQIIREQYTSRSLLLNRLISNQYSNLKILNNSLTNYRIILDSAFYCTCIIKLSRETDEDFFLDSPAYYATYPDCRVYCTEESNHSLYAIVCSNFSNNTQLQNLFQSMLLQLNQQDIQADIYAGSCVPKEELIHTSYIEALSQYNYEKAPDNRIHYYRASSFENTAILYPQNELSGLQNALASQNYENVLSILGSLSFQISQGTFNYSMLNTVCYEVFNTIYKSHSESLLSGGHSIGSYLSRLSRLNTTEDSLAFLELLQEPFREHPDPSDSSYSTDINKKMSKIQAYIQENYMNSDFYLGAVADRFNLSLNNLSQQFKRYSGMSPVKYITFLRIDKAKELLTKTDISIRDIAFEVGYSDPSVFVRNFKRATALTPVQYRESVKVL